MNNRFLSCELFNEICEHIYKGNTGNYIDFAEKLQISKSTLYNQINYFNELLIVYKVSIEYDYKGKTYYFTRPGIMKWKMSFEWIIVKNNFHVIIPTFLEN